MLAWQQFRIAGYLSFAAAWLPLTGLSMAAELAPGNGHSIDLGRFHGIVYYTIEQDGYRVVATLATQADTQPIRFVFTLESGQRMTISVPRATGQPSINLEFLRSGEALLMSEPIAAVPLGSTDEIRSPVRFGG
jgi:hypothetical protein